MVEKGRDALVRTRSSESEREAYRQVVLSRWKERTVGHHYIHDDWNIKKNGKDQTERREGGKERNSSLQPKIAKSPSFGM